MLACPSAAPIELAALAMLITISTRSEAEVSAEGARMMSEATPCHSAEVQDPAALTTTARVRDIGKIKAGEREITSVVAQHNGLSLHLGQLAECSLASSDILNEYLSAPGASV